MKYLQTISAKTPLRSARCEHFVPWARALQYTTHRTGNTWMQSQLYPHSHAEPHYQDVLLKERGEPHVLRTTHC
jgi:hypothetical protein